MLIRCVGMVLGSCILVAAAAAQERSAPTSRRLPFMPPTVELPLTPVHLARATAELGWAARLAIGYEAPTDEPWEAPTTPATGRIQSGGQTVQQVLDAIVARRPRYTWNEDDGVIHLRPAAASIDPGNVLNRPVDRFQLDDTTLQEALREVQLILHPERRGGGVIGSVIGSTPLSLRRFSITVTDSTVMGVLDAIVKAHGESVWACTYGRDAGGNVIPNFAFSTFDGWGIRG